MNKKNHRTICDVHNLIMRYSLDIGKLKVTDYDDPEDYASAISSLSDKIYSLADEALSYGQLMEDRLNDYYEAIRDLGFTRNEK